MLFVNYNGIILLSIFISATDFYRQRIIIFLLKDCFSFMYQLIFYFIYFFVLLFLCFLIHVFFVVVHYSCACVCFSSFSLKYFPRYAL